MKRLLLVLLLGILAVTAYTFCKSWSLPDFPDSPQYRDGKFQCPAPSGDGPARRCGDLVDVPVQQARGPCPPTRFR